MHVAVVGSTDFPLQKGAGYILQQMTQLPAGTIVVVRGSTVSPRTPLRGVDALAVAFAKALALDVRIVSGAGSSWGRTVSLVKQADMVLAYFSPERVMTGGTGVLVEVALNEGRVVSAWTLTDTGLVPVP